jgi:hypothetical protein
MKIHACGFLIGAKIIIGDELKRLNPDFAVEIAMRFLKALFISVSGNFRAGEIVIYSMIKNVKKCPGTTYFENTIDILLQNLR